MPHRVLPATGDLRSTIDGRRVVRVIVLAVLATAVLPPAGASWLNSRRIDVTKERVERSTLRADSVGTGLALCGPGRLPDLDVIGAHASHATWISIAVGRPEAFGPDMRADGWGRCFLANDRWILSAGPNGVVDTPFDAVHLAGDDIGMMLR
ncbi:MAG: hypothetical protein AB7L71_00825 [Vicinamibacterales bacterium]